MFVSVRVAHGSFSEHPALLPQLRLLSLTSREHETGWEFHTLQWGEMFELLNRYQCAFVYYDFASAR